MGGIEIATLIAVLIAMGFAIHQIRTDPRITREFMLKTARTAGLYFLFVAVGIGALLGLMRISGGEHAAAFLLGFFLFWIAFGMVWLIRTVPRLREPPAWLMRRWTWLDWLLIGGAALCAHGAVLRI